MALQEKRYFLILPKSFVFDWTCYVHQGEEIRMWLARRRWVIVHRPSKIVPMEIKLNNNDVGRRDRMCRIATTSLFWAPGLSVCILCKVISCAWITIRFRFPCANARHEKIEIASRRISDDFKEENFQT